MSEHDAQQEHINDLLRDAWDQGFNTGIGYSRMMHLPEPTNPYAEKDDDD